LTTIHNPLPRVVKKNKRPSPVAVKENHHACATPDEFRRLHSTHSIKNDEQRQSPPFHHCDDGTLLVPLSGSPRSVRTFTNNACLEVLI
jgi:hypothetical protein